MRVLAAIFIRALREHTRSRMLGIARGVFAGMVIWIFILQAMRSPVAPGLQFLYGILFLNVVFILLASTSYFASSITEEKEDGTITLLAIAGVSPTGLLFAKSTTRILEGILLLAVQFPFALLAVTLGGVMWDQVIASYIALGGFLILSGNLALLASVVARRTSAAAIGITAMLVVLLFGDNLLSLLGMDRLAEHWHSLDPFARLRETTSLSFTGPIVTSQFYFSLVVGAVAFIAARVLFARCCSLAADNGTGWISRFSSTARDRLFAPRPLHHMAIEWKDFHFLYGGNRLRRWKTRGYIVCSIFVAFVCIWTYGRINGDIIRVMGYGVFTVGIIGLFLEHAYASSRMFRAELDARTLGSLILADSMSIAAIVETKKRIASSALIPAYRTAIAGISIALFGYIIRGSMFDILGGSISTLLMVAILRAFWFFYGTLLREIIVYCSLKFESGSMAVGLGIWLFFTVVLNATFGFFLPFWGIFPAVIPTFILSGKLAKKSVALLEKHAATEG